MNLLKPLKSLFGNKNVGVYVMGKNAKNKDSDQSTEPEKKVCDTVIEASQKRYDENEKILLIELPIARQKMLYDIKNGISFLGYTAKIHLFMPDYFENHPAIFQEKIWWKEQGMYLRVRVLPTESCLKLDVEFDKDGKLNEIDEQKGITKHTA